MKNRVQISFKSILFIVVILAVFSSCRYENIVTSPDNENSILEDNTVIADLISDIATNDGSNDNIIDFANCFSIKLPVIVIANDLEVIVETSEDLDVIRAIFEQSTVDVDMVEIIFPITVILTDYSEEVLNSQNELDNLSQTCNGENEPDDDNECIDFLYPISFTVFNTITEQTSQVVIQNDNELFVFVQNLNSDDVASLNFPITLVLSDDTQETVNTIDELENLIERVKEEGCDEDDDFDYVDNNFNDIQSPSTPLNLAASNITETTVDLNWDSSVDNISVTSYGIFIDDVFATSTSLTASSITNLEASTTYTFTINARDGAGNVSDKSNSVTITTLASSDTTAPAAPLNLVASNTTQTTTNLSWDAATDNIAVTSYDVYNNGALLGSTDVTTYNVSSLTASTLYTFTVIARDAANNSSVASNAVSITTLATTGDTQAPTVPLNLSASNTTSTITDLSWDASSDNVGVVGYEVYIDGVLLEFVNTTTYNVTGLTPETTYAFTVLAKDAEGNSSALSNTASVTTLAASQTLEIDDVLTTCTDWSVEQFESGGGNSTDFDGYTFNFAGDGTVIAENTANGDQFPGTWQIQGGKFRLNIPGVNGNINANWKVTTVVRADGTTIIELNSGSKILIITTSTCN